MKNIEELFEEIPLEKNEFFFKLYNIDKNKLNSIYILYCLIASKILETYLDEIENERNHFVWCLNKFIEENYPNFLYSPLFEDYFYDFFYIEFYKEKNTEILQDSLIFIKDCFDIRTIKQKFQLELSAYHCELYDLIFIIP